MKKFLLVLVLIPLLLAVGITGCEKDKDDDDNNVTGVPDAMDFEFVLNFMNTSVVNREAGRYFYFIAFSFYGGYARDGIESVSLTVDDVPVTLENLDGWDWIGSVEMNAGQTYNIDITYNDDEHHNFDLAAADAPVVAWPDTYDTSEAMPLVWTLNENAEYQFLDGWAYNQIDDNDDDNFKEFDNSDREWTVPAGWLDAGFETYDFSLAELNYIYTGDFLAINSGVSAEYYGYWRDEVEVEKKQRERLIKIVKKLLN